jgi:hypothetical protein|nr:MAG TPA: hypothetical protein [Caudoviricetes sp.]
MIEEKQVTLRKQIAADGQWLYEDQPQDNRVFAKEVYLGATTEPWAECTDAERTEWEEAHKPIDPPEPPQVEDTQAEVVE